MQSILAMASALALLTSLVHSALGEMLIFRHLRRGTLVPGLDAPPLRSRNVRILWATWHLASVFGCAFAAALAMLAFAPDAEARKVLLAAALAAHAGGALLVLVGTRGRHPGWIALGVIAGLVATALGAD